MNSKEDKNRDLIKIGQRFKDIREEKGLSQEELAAQTGISKDTISRAERGEQCISLLHFKAICSALNTSPVYFMYGNPNDKCDLSEQLRVVYMDSEKDAQLVTALMDVIKEMSPYNTSQDK